MGRTVVGEVSSRSNNRLVSLDELPETLACELPPNQEEASREYLNPPDGFCGDALDDVTQERLDQMAQAYAPYLFFHPLENYTMMGVDETFADPAAGNIQLDTETYADNLNQEDLLRSTRDLDDGIRSGSYFLQRELDDDYISGAGFNENGLSRAPIYYNAYEWENNTVVINYHFYFAFHGYADFTLLSLVQEELRATHFLAPPIEGHEGDWTSMRVLVCASEIPSTPLAVSYQHSFSVITDDCTVGDCTLYRDAIRPVGFVALGSHAIYPFSARNILLADFDSSFWVGLQGTYAVDRTSYKDVDGNVRYFEPSGTNVLRIPEQREIELGVSNPDQYWAGFAGRWGSTQLNPPNLTTAICFDSNQTSIVVCPTEDENPVFHTVQQLLGLEDSNTPLVASAAVLQVAVLNFYSDTEKSPRGPPTQPFFRDFQTGKSLPIWSSLLDDESTQEFCTRILDVPAIERLKPDVSVVDLEGNIYAVIAFVALVMLVNISFYTVYECCRSRRPALSYESIRQRDEPNWRLTWDTHRPAIFYACFYVVTMAGVAMFFIGHNALENVFQEMLGLDLGVVITSIRVFGSFLIAIDTLFLLVMWFPTRNLHSQLRRAYYRVVGDTLKAAAWDSQIYDSEFPIRAFRVLHALLLASVVFAALMVVVSGIGQVTRPRLIRLSHSFDWLVDWLHSLDGKCDLELDYFGNTLTRFGSFMIGIAYGFGDLCSSVIGALNDLCFDLTVVGLEGIPCGTEFQDFCDGFAHKEIVISLWGTWTAAAGHFYLVSSAGAVVMSFKSSETTISMMTSSQPGEEPGPTPPRLDDSVGDSPGEEKVPLRVRAADSTDSLGS